eukprot:UN22870
MNNAIKSFTEAYEARQKKKEDMKTDIIESCSAYIDKEKGNILVRNMEVKELYNDVRTSVSDYIKTYLEDKECDKLYSGEEISKIEQEIVDKHKDDLTNLFTQQYDDALALMKKEAAQYMINERKNICTGGYETWELTQARLVRVYNTFIKDYIEKNPILRKAGTITYKDFDGKAEAFVKERRDTTITGETIDMLVGDQIIKVAKSEVNT